jgi:hypothetical protein
MAKAKVTSVAFVVGLERSAVFCLKKDSGQDFTPDRCQSKFGARHLCAPAESGGAALALNTLTLP